MCAEVTTPTHTDSCKYCDSITIDPTLLNEARNKTEGCTHSTKSCDRECYKVWIAEAKEPVEDKVNLPCSPPFSNATFVPRFSEYLVSMAMKPF